VLDTVLHAEERAEDLQVDHLLALVGRDVLDGRRRAGDTRVVHENIEPAEGIDSVLDRILEVLFVGDVRLYRQRSIRLVDSLLGFVDPARSRREGDVDPVVSKGNLHLFANALLAPVTNAVTPFSSYMGTAFPGSTLNGTAVLDRDLPIDPTPLNSIAVSSVGRPARL